jgi:hypothetical protein
MSLQPRPIPPVPHETARVARAAFPKGNPYLRLRDELGTVFQDDDFADLYPRRGQPALPPWRLALVRAHDMVCTSKGPDVTVAVRFPNNPPLPHAIWGGLRTWARMPPRSARNFTHVWAG